MEIRRSQKNELESINEIISKSKSFWNYSDAYLKAAIPLIKINEEWLDQNLGYTLLNHNICGFMGIEIVNDHWKLEHLWINPEKIGQGMGRKAVTFLFEQAQKNHVSKIFLLPDPPAEGFYQKLGAKFTKKTIKSRVEDGPLFKEMYFSLD